MMNSQELETATRLGLNLVVLILQDNAYGMIRWKQAVGGLPDFGMSFGSPDFVTYAKDYGATGTCAESANRLVPALQAAFDAGGIHFVALPVDYSENIRVSIGARTGLPIPTSTFSSSSAASARSSWREWWRTPASRRPPAAAQSSAIT